jgi:hypothetical protein
MVLTAMAYRQFSELAILLQTCGHPCTPYRLCSGCHVIWLCDGPDLVPFEANVSSAPLK